MNVTHLICLKKPFNQIGDFTVGLIYEANMRPVLDYDTITNILHYERNTIKDNNGDLRLYDLYSHCFESVEEWRSNKLSLLGIE